MPQKSRKGSQGRTRPYKIGVHLNAEELAAAEKHAAKHGVSVSGAVRMLIRQLLSKKAA